MTKQLYDAVSCPKAYWLFTAEEGADGHCKGGAQVRFHRVAYDWLDKTLAPWPQTKRSAKRISKTTSTKLYVKG